MNRKGFSDFLQILQTFLFIAGIPLVQYGNTQDFPLQDIQTLNPVFRHYTVTKGLPSHEVYCVVQDSKGYMWFGTDRGVARYNGYSFEVFTTQEGMCDNTVFNIYEDRKGRIWFITFIGKLSYYQDGIISGIPANKALEEVRSMGDITSLSVDSGDTLWIGLHRTPRLIKIAPGSNTIIWQETSNMEYLKVFPNGELITGTVSSSTGSNFNICLDLNGRRRILTLKGTLHTGWSRTPRALQINNREFIYAAKGVLIHLVDTGIIDYYAYPDQINNIFRDSKGEIWVCHGTKGISRLSGDFTQPYLDGYTVTAAKEDSEGNYWFTTLEDGVFMLPSPHFKSFILDKKTNIKGFATNRGSLWAGLADGRLAQLNRGGVRVIKLPAAGKESPFLRSIATDSKGNFLIGANHTYLFKEGKFTKLIQSGLKHLTRETAGDGMLGVIVESVYRYKNGRLNHILTEECFRKYIDALHQDSIGTIWIGNLHGLWSFRDTLVHHVQENALLNNRIRDISSSSNGRLWLATLGAGVLLKQQGQIYQISVNHGLLSNMCNSLFIENDSILWVCTNKGLNRVHIINPEEGRYSVDSYTSLDGLLSDEVMHVTMFNGLMWVATGDGITCFDPLKVQAAHVPPPVYIQGLQVNSVNASADKLANLSYKENLVDIDYIGISFRTGNKLMYRYRLRGWENEWNYTRNTSVRYPNLPSGDYEFFVYAQNKDRSWSTEPACVSFSISKPFWETGLFISGSGLTFGGLVFGSIFFRIRNIKKREAEKNELSKKQIELELKALRAQMNPHFTFNTMNSIQDFVIQKDTGSASEYLVMFASLMRRILNNSRKTFITLQEELESIRLYLELEAMRLDNKFGFKISTDDEVDLNYERVSPLLIQPYVENAIWHGLMSKEGKGELNIDIVRSGNMIICTIRDNGIGRKRAEELRSEHGIKHESMGMKITDECLTLLNKITNKRITVEFTDLADETGYPLGTQVKISFLAQTIYPD